MKLGHTKKQKNTSNIIVSNSWLRADHYVVRPIPETEMNPSTNSSKSEPRPYGHRKRLGFVFRIKKKSCTVFQNYCHFYGIIFFRIPIHKSEEVKSRDSKIHLKLEFNNKILIGSLSWRADYFFSHRHP